MNTGFFRSMLMQMFGGAWVTMQIFFITLLFAIPFGFLITYLYSNKNKAVKSATGFYVLIMRGTPLLLQMFFIYYGLPRIPYVGKYLIFERFESACVAFVLNYAAYFAEIFRGGLLSVDKGQYEAARVLGISKLQTSIRIVIPQMIKVILPSISNEAIILVKDTALVSVLAQEDLLHVTRSIVNSTGNVMPFAVAAVFYLVMSYGLTVFFQKLELIFMWE